jgi:hypothetical protein
MLNLPYFAKSSFSDNVFICEMSFFNWLFCIPVLLLFQYIFCTDWLVLRKIYKVIDNWLVHIAFDDIILVIQHCFLSASRRILLDGLFLTLVVIIHLK